ncbi:hypothetical protein PMZ80_002305 [Knufia obscura]|uniref:Transcription initiation factor TFIID subunit 4 n=1 Tax=Knufia obscura TaxID=1635080 RepID=A0ABR0RWY0_9EURO|nr:hypothetical protein PMZ80_002305 [Knufia obscura]
MAQPPPPQPRPSFSQQPQSFNHAYPQPNGRPQFNPQSPAGSLSYSSPSPQPQFSPTYTGQAPPPKRPRLSPDAPSSFAQQPVHTPQAGSPVNGQMNGISHPVPQRSGSMAPPQQPYIKREDRDGDMSFLREGNFDFGGAPSPAFPNQAPSPNGATSFTSGPGPFNNANDNHIRPGSSGARMGAPQAPQPPQPVVSQEEREARTHQRADWEEARHSQHELWDPFVYGGTLNEKIKAISHRSNLVEPQSGVLVNTQKNQPPPVVRVNGLEGATRVIDQGQSILDTKEKAERLNELVKLLSLSTKARITGLVQAAARLALERRQHSQGRIPEDWSDMAVAPKPTETEPQNVSTSGAGAGMKRTHAQANEESSSRPLSRASAHPAKAEFEKFSSRELKAEQARQAKRRKRNEVISAQETAAEKQAEAAAIAAVAAENEKKTSKKERKIAETKITEQQQHASTNQAARTALTGGMLGRFGGNKKKTYSWMGGGSGSGPQSSAATPTRAVSVAAPAQEKAAEVPKAPQFGQFDEETESGIQARDLLLVLESDGRAARSFVKGSSIVDDTVSRPEI